MELAKTQQSDHAVLVTSDRIHEEIRIKGLSTENVLKLHHTEHKLQLHFT